MSLRINDYGLSIDPDLLSSNELKPNEIRKIVKNITKPDPSAVHGLGLADANLITTKEGKLYYRSMQYKLRKTPIGKYLGWSDEVVPPRKIESASSLRRLVENRPFSSPIFKKGSGKSLTGIFEEDSGRRSMFEKDSSPPTFIRPISKTKLSSSSFDSRKSSRIFDREEHSSSNFDSRKSSRIFDREEPPFSRRPERYENNRFSSFSSRNPNPEPYPFLREAFITDEIRNDITKEGRIIPFSSLFPKERKQTINLNQDYYQSRFRGGGYNEQSQIDLYQTGLLDQYREQTITDILEYRELLTLKDSTNFQDYSLTQLLTYRERLKRDLNTGMNIDYINGALQFGSQRLCSFLNGKTKSEFVNKYLNFTTLPQRLNKMMSLAGYKYCLKKLSGSLNMADRPILVLASLFVMTVVGAAGDGKEEYDMKKERIRKKKEREDREIAKRLRLQEIEEMKKRVNVEKAVRNQTDSSKNNISIPLPSDMNDTSTGNPPIPSGDRVKKRVRFVDEVLDSKPSKVHSVLQGKKKGKANVKRRPHKINFPDDGELRDSDESYESEDGDEDESLLQKIKKELEDDEQL